MAIHFQTLRSSSAGNCLAFWTGTSSVLIDCGVKTQRECRDLLDAHRRRAGTLDAVIVSHAHGDHVSRAALKVLAAEGLPILGDARVVRQVREAHETQEWATRPGLRAIPAARFEVGDFRIAPFEVPHAPHYPNFGFVIQAHDGGRRRTIVACTDFNDYAGVLRHFVDADAILLEANHDLGLLRAHPNPSSRYHLNNVKAASLLYHAIRKSATQPGAVLLAHLSEERNRRALAIGEVRRLFKTSGLDLRFHLDAAPAGRPSEVVAI